MGNVYLEKQREKYEGLRSAIEAIQTKAASENRGLTDDELTSVKAQGDEGKKLLAEIESLTEIETRNAKVGQLAASLTGDGTGSGPGAGSGKGNEQGQEERPVGFSGQEMRSYRSAIYTQARDPGHYRSVFAGGKHSFFGDIFASSTQDDRGAATRLLEHHRAVTTGGTTNISGTIPPRWVVEEYEAQSRQNRLLANAVRNVPLGGDFRPMTLPKQTAGTDNNVTAQTAEGANNDEWDTDAFETGDDTVTPKMYSGSQIVSIQSLLTGNPATDLLIYTDLQSVFDYKMEVLVGNTMLTAAVAASDGAIATEAAFQGMDAGAVDAVIDASTQAFAARFLPPDILVPTIRRFGKFRKLRDSTGRKLMTMDRYNPQNAVGLVSGPQIGEFEGLTVLPTAGLGAGTSYPEKFLVARSSDTILYGDPVQRFKYEQTDGPANVKIGIWGFAACITRFSGAGTVAVTVTAAS